MPSRRPLRSFPLALMALLMLGACAGGATGGDGRAAARFQKVAGSPPALRAFLHQMPKGADLHTHLSGAVYAETFLEMAVAKGLCVDMRALALAPPPCHDDRHGDRHIAPAAEALKDTDLYNRMIDSLSMRDFVAENGVSGHDRFFATFARFNAAADADAMGEMAAEVVDRAGRQNVQHIEPMITLRGGEARALGKKIGWMEDLTAFQTALDEAGLPAIVARAKADLDAIEATRLSRLGCGTPTPKPGCAVSVRYIQQVTRVMPPAQVFAQTLLGFELVKADARVVGVNFVAPEDAPTALADYDLHMRMLDHLGARLPGVNVALHAGELTLGLVRPDRLGDHIRKAVEVAHAKRIGHGVDIMYEDRPWELLATMAERRVAVEINLSSNDMILGVRGAAHPFDVYRQAGVPLVISTDDEGVSRGDLTHELQRAVETYHLTYADLVGFARRGLEYSFLPGASLWSDADAWRPVGPCAEGALGAQPAPESCAPLLAASAKAARQWTLEGELSRFEGEDRFERAAASNRTDPATR